MSLRTLKIPSAVLAIALIAAGCGSGDDETALTKAQFIKQGDAICKEADEVQLKGLGKAEEETPMAQRSKAGQEEILVTVGLPPVEQEAEELGELSAPEGDEEEIEAIVAGIEEGVAKFKKEPLVFTAAGAPNPFAKPDKMSAEYGFKECREAL